jgi:hypothetical protein
MIGDSIVGNLHLAEKQERFAFWQSLARTHPERFEYRLAQVHWQLRNGFAHFAFVACTQLLSQTNSAKNNLLLHYIRLQAAPRCNRFESFCEDFAATWNADPLIPGARTLRPAFLSVIAELTTVHALPALEALSTKGGYCHDVLELVSAKAAELAMLDKVRSKYKQPGRATDVDKEG